MLNLSLNQFIASVCILIKSIQSNLSVTFSCLPVRMNWKRQTEVTPSTLRWIRIRTARRRYFLQAPEFDESVSKASLLLLTLLNVLRATLYRAS